MGESNPEILKEIVERAKAGDKEAFSFLYKAYFSPLYRYIYFRVSSKAEAEDLTQDVFLKAYASFDRFSYTGVSPLAYFYTIARNTVIDYRRKKRVLVADEDSSLEAADDVDDPQGQAIKEEDAEELHRVIGLLPEDQQDAIVMRFIDEVPNKEIARMLGKSEESVRQLQSRGLRALRKRYIS